MCLQLDSGRKQKSLLSDRINELEMAAAAGEGELRRAQDELEQLQVGCCGQGLLKFVWNTSNLLGVLLYVAHHQLLVHAASAVVLSKCYCKPGGGGAA